MQATPQDISGGIPNGRDTAETHAHPGQMLDMGGIVQVRIDPSQSINGIGEYFTDTVV